MFWSGAPTVCKIDMPCSFKQRKNEDFPVLHTIQYVAHILHCVLYKICIYSTVYCQVHTTARCFRSLQYTTIPTYCTYKYVELLFIGCTVHILGLKGLSSEN